MNLRFDIRKTTQMAAMLLERAGGSMEYIKLLKLLYLCDRKAFDDYGSPISGDHYVSMKFGPVMSNTYDIIKADPFLDSSYWDRHITRDGYSLRLTGKPEEVLSEADEELVAKVFATHGDSGPWELVDLCHAILPEWQDPKGSSIPIAYEDILTALGKSEEEKRDRLSSINALATLQQYSHAPR